MERIAAVILAGGRGERLGGVIKANLLLGGVRLLDRVAARLREASPIIVAHGPLEPGRLELGTGLVGVPDLEADYAGPLAGFAAAVDWLIRRPDPPQMLVSTAVDTPFLTADYLARLVATIGNEPAAVAAFGAQDYPTHALWRLAAVAGLPDAVLAGTAPRSLRRLIGSLGGVRVDWRSFTDEDPFTGVNTPTELDAAELRAALEDGRRG